MNPQRRTALISVGAAAALIALKLIPGITTHSLGLISEALHSGTDLVAALLTFFAIGVAIRPADRAHAYGHGKAEHLAALAEAGFLVVASLFIIWRGISHFVGRTEATVEAKWYALAVIGAVIVIDAGRMIVSLRTARRYRSAALQSNALHFGSDLVGSIAVLIGLVFVRAGFRDADSAAALFVAVLVIVAAARLIRRNVDVLMDRAPAGAYEAAQAAIQDIQPPVQLRRLRIRQAAGRHFADVVIGVAPDAVVGQGHAAADAVEDAIERALPETDVVVHVEPRGASDLRERIQVAAASVPQVREIHNVSAVGTPDGVTVSLHLKLPGSLSLEHAHEVASEVERAIEQAAPEVASVQTHLEPLDEEAEGHELRAADIARDTEIVERIVEQATGRASRSLLFLRTDAGLVVFLTLALDPRSELAEAHSRASEIEEKIREAVDVSDVIVHTEP
ncbi:MAG: cation diffusion facilitator family transporter [Actinobacteria bacterium]|nr:cation diffusion facilitator family transporter [Actinomycetota bacterium]